MYTFITNPNARSGKGAQIWASIEPLLNQQQVNYRVFFTRYQRHATLLTREITSEHKRCTIVILGGDGTVNEVLNGIEDLELVTLGYIPTGSSNDFSRGYGLPSDPVAALKSILRPSGYHLMNVGLLTYPNKIRQDSIRRFAVSSGIGFDAEVCHQAVISRMKILLNKFGLGKLSYAVIALQRMLTLKPGNMELVLDQSKKVVFSKCYFIAVMNHRFEGGGFQFCPKANPGDDILDLVVLSDISKLKALALLPTAFNGWHVHFKGVSVFQCKRADILSERPLPVHTDGEPIFLQQQLCFTLDEKKIRVITS